jgi:hypothetical protein
VAVFMLRSLFERYLRFGRRYQASDFPHLAEHAKGGPWAALMPGSYPGRSLSVAPGDLKGRTADVRASCLSNYTFCLLEEFVII